MSSRVQWTCYVQKMLFWPSPPQPLALTVLTSSLLWRSPSLGVGWGRVRYKHPNYRWALHWPLLSACWPHLTPFKGQTKGWVHKMTITNLYGRFGTYEDITVDNRYIGQHKGDENRGIQNQFHVLVELSDSWSKCIIIVEMFMVTLIASTKRRYF